MNAQEVERYLHEHFAEYRQEGEWFAVDFQTAVDEAKLQTFETEEPGKLLTFEFEANQLRTMVDEKGETWFCLKDACNILSIGNPSELVKRLKKSGVISTEVAFERSVARLNFIDEPNFYRVIFGSRKKKATTFQDWVFDEVLPSIRKTGQYSLPKQTLKGKVEQMDFTKFIEDCFIPDPTNREKSRDIYPVYQSWCLLNKCPARTIQWVGMQLKKQGYKKGKCPPKNLACWYGFRLNNPACPTNPTTLEDLQNYLTSLGKNLDSGVQYSDAELLNVVNVAIQKAMDIQ